MKKFLSFAIAAAFVLAAPGMALAKAKGEKKAAGAHGKVSAVDATAKTITITHGKGGEAKVFTITDATTITVDGAAGKLADITTGMLAKVSEGTPAGTAASVEATKHEKGKGGKKKKNT